MVDNRAFFPVFRILAVTIQSIRIRIQVFAKCGSGSSLWLNTDPIRIQAKIYDKISLFKPLQNVQTLQT